MTHAPFLHSEETVAAVEDYGQILSRNAAAMGERPAVMHKDRVVTHGELFVRTCAISTLFRDLGIRKGQCIGVLAGKNPCAIECFLAAALAGAVFFPVDCYQPRSVSEEIVRRMQPSMLVAEADFFPMALELALFGDNISVVAASDKMPVHVPSFADLDLSRPVVEPGIRLMADDPIYYNFTSGTTGRPKAAVTTLGNIHYNTLASNESFYLTGDDVHMCMMPIFVHPHELFARPLFLGGSFVLTDSVAPKSIAALIDKHHVTAFMAVASIYETLIQLPRHAHARLDSLRIPESGGMFATSDLVFAFRERYGKTMMPVWGSTEATGIAIASRPDEAYRPGTMGRPCPYYDVQIRSEEGGEAEVGEPGELVVGGPGVITSYYDDPDEASVCLAGGAFHTRDIVKQDQDGYIFFQCRQSSMMKVGGMKVFPTEIEECLRSHPDIIEVAVLKSHDTLRGEVPKAFIVKRPGAQLDRSGVIAHCRAHLHRFKTPRCIEFLEELPKTPGGKLAWRKLLSE